MYLWSKCLYPFNLKLQETKNICTYIYKCILAYELQTIKTNTKV